MVDFVIHGSRDPIAYVNKFGKPGTYDLNASGVITVDGIQEKVYQRILIRKKQ